MRKELIDSLPTDLNIKGDPESREVYINGDWLTPRYSQILYNHSPDGFNWGYGGSGPAQMALAILIKFLPVEEALSLYQYFKFDFVAGLPFQNSFDVTINLKEIISELCQRYLKD